MDFPAADRAEWFEESESLSADFDVAVRHPGIEEVDFMPAALWPILPENLSGSAEPLE